MFVKFAQIGKVPDEHRDLFEYFKEHYKNSNKGIKGRGKARTVAVRKPKVNSQHQPQHQQQLPPPMMASHFSHGPMPSSTPAYVPRNYGMFDHEHEQNAATGMLYDDEHARQMAFANRLY